MLGRLMGGLIVLWGGVTARSGSQLRVAMSRDGGTSHLLKFIPLPSIPIPQQTDAGLAAKHPGRSAKMSNCSQGLELYVMRNNRGILGMLNSVCKRFLADSVGVDGLHHLG